MTKRNMLFSEKYFITTSRKGDFMLIFFSVSLKRAGTPVRSITTPIRSGSNPIRSADTLIEVQALL
jgi:hypothetical protein